MAAPSMSLNEFIDKVIQETFRLSEEKFAPVPEDDRKKHILGLVTQLSGGKPKRFLRFLETVEDPKRIVEDAFETLNGFPPEYVLQPRPGEIDKEHILSVFAVRNVEHIITYIFNGPGHSSFEEDLKNIYNFLRQKTSQSMVDSDSGKSENGFDIILDLREDECRELIGKYANALFSVHLFAKKITKNINVCQYL